MMSKTILELQASSLYEAGGDLFFVCKTLDNRVTPEVAQYLGDTLKNLRVMWRHQNPQVKEFAHQPVFGRIVASRGFPGGVTALVRLYGKSRMPYVDVKRKAMITMMKKSVSLGKQIGLSMTFDAVEEGKVTVEAEPIEVSVTPWPACESCVIDMKATPTIKEEESKETLELAKKKKKDKDSKAGKDEDESKETEEDEETKKVDKESCGAKKMEDDDDADDGKDTPKSKDAKADKKGYKKKGKQNEETVVPEVDISPEIQNKINKALEDATIEELQGLLNSKVLELEEKDKTTQSLESRVKELESTMAKITAEKEAAIRAPHEARLTKVDKAGLFSDLMKTMSVEQMDKKSEALEKAGKIDGAIKVTAMEESASAAQRGTARAGIASTDDEPDEEKKIRAGLEMTDSTTKIHKKYEADLEELMNKKGSALKQTKKR